MISAGRQTDLQALPLSSSLSSSTQLFARLSAPAGSEKDAVRYPLHEHQSGCSTGDNGDPQAAVRTRCIHAHFANVLLRRQTARIRQGGQNLQADQVVDQFVRIGGSSGPTMCEAHRTSLASTCGSPQRSGNARHCLLTSVDSHCAGGNQETDVFRRTACGCRFEIG